MQIDRNQIALQLHAVQTLLETVLQETGTESLVPENSVVGTGKMLRAQLTLILGMANEIDETTARHTAAVVEIIHGASLLHDDVIDGAVLRRGAPAFWKQHGINGAILLGDLLVFKGMELLVQIERSDLIMELIGLAGRICLSEVNQELLLRGAPGTWAECEKIAQEKTGSLFAFAALAAGKGSEQIKALREAGFRLGTAYQLADDLLDGSQNEAVSGKTLGLDRKRGKTTAGTVISGMPSDLGEYIDALLDQSVAPLKPWPTLQNAWINYLDETMRPVLRVHLEAQND